MQNVSSYIILSKFAWQLGLYVVSMYFPIKKLMISVIFQCLKPYLYPIQEVKDAIQLQPMQSLQNFAHVLAA